MRGSTPGSPKIMARWHVWLWEAASLAAVFSGTYYRWWHWTKSTRVLVLPGVFLQESLSNCCLWQMWPLTLTCLDHVKKYNSKWSEESLHDTSSYSRSIWARFFVSSCWVLVFWHVYLDVYACLSLLSHLQWFIPKGTKSYNSCRLACASCNCQTKLAASWRNTMP